MTFASSAFGQLRYITEVTPGTTPGSGNGVNLRMTGPTTKASVSSVTSNEIRADRLSTGLTLTDMNIDGGFNFELSGKEYDPFLEGLLDSAYTHFGTNGLGAVFTATTAATTITAGVATTGSSIFTALPNGSWIKVIPPAGASSAIKAYFSDRWFKVASTTSTVITLDASTPISGAGLGITGVAGYAVSQSRVQNGTGLNRAFTLEYAMTDITQFLPFRGMRTNTLDLSLDVGSIITGSFGFVGQGHDGMVGATTLPGSPVASQSLDVMNAVADVGLIYENGASIFNGSTSFIKSVKLNVTNNMRGQKAIGVYGNAGVGFGELAITGSMDVYVENASYYNKWLAGTNTSLALGVADSAGNGYLFEMDKVQFKDGGLNLGGRNDDIMLSLPFQAFYSASTGRGLRITRAVAA
jgi:Phage tail tube protein